MTVRSRLGDVGVGLLATLIAVCYVALAILFYGALIACTVFVALLVFGYITGTDVLGSLLSVI